MSLALPVVSSRVVRVAGLCDDLLPLKQIVHPADNDHHANSYQENIPQRHIGIGGLQSHCRSSTGSDRDQGDLCVA